MSTLGRSAESASATEAPAKRRGLPFSATVYLAVVGAIAAVVALPALQDLSLATPGWTTFLLLTGGAAVAQLFTVRTKRNYAYHTTSVFLVAGALLLPAALVALMRLTLRVPDWALRRDSSAIHAFNVADLHGWLRWRRTPARTSRVTPFTVRTSRLRPPGSSP